NYLEGYGQQAGIPGTDRRDSVREAGENDYQLEEYRLIIDKTLSASLNEVAASLQVTINTVFQTTWGILLQRYNNSNDAVFGVVVSGRPAEIEGIEKMIGLFINTIPLRITRGKDQLFFQLLKTVQQGALLSREHEYFSLAEVQATSALKGNLIHHIMVFENYPTFEVKENRAPGKETPIDIKAVALREQTNYDFNIIIVPGNKMTIKFSYNSLVYKKDFIKRVVGVAG
ncbi:MAG: non-ribosomal peptide synthase, partial [bacterium]|nr:non-ribosomal peptide synthase [bacterium]